MSRTAAANHGTAVVPQLVLASSLSHPKGGRGFGGGKDNASQAAGPVAEPSHPFPHTSARVYDRQFSRLQNKQRNNYNTHLVSSIAPLKRTLGKKPANPETQSAPQQLKCDGRFKSMAALRSIENKQQKSQSAQAERQRHHLL
jgi:hypothetical protein